MKYTLHIIATGLKTQSKWFYNRGGFIINEVKIGEHFQPQQFDTIEAARSAAYQYLIEKDRHDFIYLCDANGAQIERIERK